MLFPWYFSVFTFSCGVAEDTWPKDKRIDSNGNTYI
jgi:hypothetical protein